MFFAQPVTVYWTSQIVTLEAPLALEVPKRLGQLNRDPIPTAQMLAELVNERKDLIRSRNQTARLYGEGVYDGSSARIISEGNQWVTSVRAPSIQVESVSGTAAATLARQSREIQVISRTLNELQDRFQVPASQRLSLTLTPPAPTAEIIRGSRVRAGAAFAMVGLRAHPLAGLHGGEACEPVRPRGPRARLMIAHVLLTRFNLPTRGPEQYVRAKEGWLRDRMHLFEAFSVPSVRAQTEPVRWLVYIDPESPRWLFERLGPLVDEQLFVLHARQEVTTVDLLSDIRSLLPQSTTRVITTNLDNDDGLALDFSARVRTRAALPGTAAIYVDRGVVLAGDLLYLRKDPANAFCSVVTDVGLDVTCWLDWHNRLHLHMPVRHVGGSPGWLQTVHGGNVSNRVRGRLVAPSRVGDHFPGPPRNSAGTWALRLGP